MNQDENKKGQNQQNHVTPSEAKSDGHARMENKMIDLNMKPTAVRVHEQAPNDQVD